MSPNRREVIGNLGLPILAAGVFASALAPSRSQARTRGTAASRTSVSIVGNRYFLNGKPTYLGRTYRGGKIEGLLFTSRMANAVVDDQNSATRGVWAYPDGPWDPERNTNEFIANLPRYRACGLTSVAINIQGGSPQGYSWHQPWQLSGFEPDGALRADYRARLARVIEAADGAGMVVVLGLFYVSATPALRDEAAVVRAADEVVEFLCAGGWRNVLVEVGNEVDLPNWKYDIVKPARCHELVARIQKRSAGRLKTPARRLLVSTSFVYGTPPDDFLSLADYVLVHGNACKTPDDLRTILRNVRRSRAYKGQPLLNNEDDHYAFDQPDNNMLAAIGEYTGWGYFDYRRDRERYADGYQSLPVDWGINSKRKKDFFTLLAEVTGGQAP